MPSNHPTILPTFEPTLEPTLEPTYNTPSLNINENSNYIGDYKISLQSISHDNWLLCDGSFIDKTIYYELFNIIGYTFGNDINNVLSFKLPNPKDTVLGISGSIHSISTQIGEESIILNVDNIPKHDHFIATSYNSSGYYDEINYPYLAQTGTYNSGLLTEMDDRYELRAQTYEPNIFKSSSVGNSTGLNIIQPTTFIGNLFIYSGVLL